MSGHLFVHNACVPVDISGHLIIAYALVNQAFSKVCSAEPNCSMGGKAVRKNVFLEHVCSKDAILRQWAT